MCEQCKALENMFREHLAAVKKADKTPPYDYGRRKRDRNRLGDPPPVGARWLTPAELAEVVEPHLNAITHT